MFSKQGRGRLRREARTKKRLHNKVSGSQRDVQEVAPRTAGYGLGFPATLFLSTVLRALHDLSVGGDFHPVPGYVLRLETYYGLRQR